MRARLPLEHVHHLGVPDAIDVRLRLRAEAAVEVIRDLLGGRNTDVVRQEVVHPAHESAQRDRERRVVMRLLCDRVHARVGAPRPLDPDLGAVHPRPHLLDHARDGERIRLRLPPRVARPEVLDGEEKPYLKSFTRTGMFAKPVSFDTWSMTPTEILPGPGSMISSMEYV